MAFDIYFTDRIRTALHTIKAPYTEKKMMGGLLFMVHNAMCINADQDKVTGEDRLMVRVGKENYAELLSEKGARLMDFTGKPMKGFLFVYPKGTETNEQLLFWIQKALAYNKTLL